MGKVEKMEEKEWNDFDEGKKLKVQGLGNKKLE